MSDNGHRNPYPDNFDTFKHNFSAGYGQALGSRLGDTTGIAFIAGVTLTATYGYNLYVNQRQTSVVSESNIQEN